MNKKIMFTILCVFIISCILCMNISASTIVASPNYIQTFTPRSIILNSHDEILISNSNFWDNAESSSTNIEGMYTLDIESNGTHTFYYLDDYFDSIYMEFDDFHVNSITDGPWLSNYFEIACSGNDQLVIDVFVYYEVSYYLGDGSLMTIDREEYYQSDDNQYFVNVRQYAEQEFTRNGWISAFEITVVPSEPCDAFTISYYPLANYGVEHGPRILDSIEITRVENIVNPNILGWLTTSIDGFMKTEIFGDLTIGGIIAFVLAIPMVTWFLKLVAGG